MVSVWGASAREEWRGRGGGERPHVVLVEVGVRLQLSYDAAQPLLVHLCAVEPAQRYRTHAGRHARAGGSPGRGLAARRPGCALSRRPASSAATRRARRHCAACAARQTSSASPRASPSGTACSRSLRRQRTRRAWVWQDSPRAEERVAQRTSSCAQELVQPRVSAVELELVLEPARLQSPARCKVPAAAA